ncbi:MAG TPA: universal stress protein [Acidimicrobiales bacterium]
MKRIVVGIDGSAASRQALRYAVDEARAHGGRIDAVHTWHPVVPALYPMGAVALDVGLMETGAKEVLDGVVDGIDTSGLAEPIERIVACGGAAERLLDIAKGADLLVVGSRGLGGFGSLLLGSVSQQCVHHAGCPVVVVRPPAA